MGWYAAGRGRGADWKHRDQLRGWAYWQLQCEGLGGINHRLGKSLLSRNQHFWSLRLLELQQMQNKLKNPKTKAATTTKPYSGAKKQALSIQQQMRVKTVQWTKIHSQHALLAKKNTNVLFVQNTKAYTHTFICIHTCRCVIYTFMHPHIWPEWI